MKIAFEFEELIPTEEDVLLETTEDQHEYYDIGEVRYFVGVIDLTGDLK